jgi:hypothetical protein
MSAYLPIYNSRGLRFKHKEKIKSFCVTLERDRLSIGFNSHLVPFSRTGFPACSTKNRFSCGMGIEQALGPVPQKFNFLVGWASCPSVKDLLRILQDVSFN